MNRIGHAKTTNINLGISENISSPGRLQSVKFGPEYPGDVSKDSGQASGRADASWR